ncbi:MAG: hypothetical protein ACKOUR_20230, partial [Planctomycetota bacterium]
MQQVFAVVHKINYVNALMNTSNSMNKQPPSETAIAQALSAKLRELLEQVAWLRRVRVVKGDGKGAVGHNFQVILSLASG